MKSFDRDWREVFAALPAWAALPPEARRAVLRTMKPSQGASAEDLGEAAGAVRASGLVDAGPTGKRLVPRPGHRALVLVFRALDRQRIWEAPSLAALGDYLQEHFTTDELLAFLPRQRHAYAGYAGRREVAAAVASEEWVESFLAADTHEKAVAWEEARLAARETPRFVFPKVWETARRMVVELAALPAPAALRELPERFAGVDAATLGAALQAALRYLLLFAGMGDGDLEPRVGPWPPVAARLRAGPPAPPAPVEAVERFEAAWAMEDMTTVLVAASAEPVRLRTSDHAVFARALETIGARLVPLPEWVEALAGEDRGERVESAAARLREAGLAALVQPGDGTLRLAPTKKGATWLALSDRERLASFLDPLRASKERNPPSGYDPGTGAGFFPVRLQMTLRKDAGLDLRADLTRLLLALPEGFVPIGAFVEHAARADNPFLAPSRRGESPFAPQWGGRQPSRHELETLWSELLLTFLVHRLAALGGARIGLAADGLLCFALTRAGRYLLGAADGFDYGHDGAAEVIVQPDFEVVFLAPAPRVEAQLGRFAERVGPAPGVAFRLTRASVLAAAEAGMTEAQLLEALRSASSRALPANVARQLRDWLGAVRRVRMRPALLLECPDAETAGRVRAAAGKGVRALTETVLELPETPAKERSALLRKLRASGVFVQ
ncbi:MAG TPA: helicase-associated domain-containing protein [Longimicrobium sp.]|nr:helicase-associated domain-containing protein [Longimicrobium sp.]